MRTRILVAGAGCLAIMSASVALGSAHTHVAARDSFSGRIAAATHRFTSDTGRVTLDLAASHPVGRTRQLTITLHGAPCGSAKRCLALTGKLHGTLTWAFSVPDIGQRFTIRASGAVQPLGPASANGSVHGTGFLLRGRETLQLTLATHDSSVTLTARSGLVPGFTGP